MPPLERGRPARRVAVFAAEEVSFGVLDGDHPPTVKVRWPLESIRDICAYEGKTLLSVEEPTLDRVLQAMDVLRAEIETALPKLPPDS